MNKKTKQNKKKKKKKKTKTKLQLLQEDKQIFLKQNQF